MAKASAPGRTKTRLVPPLTLQEAADLNTAFLRDISANIIAASELAPIDPWMAFAPAGSEVFFRETLPPSVSLLETSKDGFGNCLCHAVRSLLEAGYRSACVLNSDSPTLPVAYLVAAATALAANDGQVVVGPATDGGYYLLGMTEPHARLFENVDWSTERVLAQTLDRARELGLQVNMLPTWYDVDDREALAVLMDEALYQTPFRQVAASPLAPMATRDVLRQLIDHADLANRLSADLADSRVA